MYGTLQERIEFINYLNTLPEEEINRLKEEAPELFLVPNFDEEAQEVYSKIEDTTRSFHNCPTEALTLVSKGEGHICAEICENPSIIKDAEATLVEGITFYESNKSSMGDIENEELGNSLLVLDSNIAGMKYTCNSDSIRNELGVTTDFRYKTRKCDVSDVCVTMDSGRSLIHGYNPNSADPDVCICKINDVSRGFLGE